MQAKPRPAEGTGCAAPGSATAAASPDVGWLRPGPSGAAGGLACALMQGMGMKNYSKPTGFAEVFWGSCALPGG